MWFHANLGGRQLMCDIKAQLFRLFCLSIHSIQIPVSKTTKKIDRSTNKQAKWQTKDVYYG